MRVLMLSLCALAIWLTSEVYAQGTKLNVGFIAAFSGPAQAYGDAARNGFELALNEVSRGNIHVTYEDDQFTPSKAVAAFQKIVQSNLADIVICVGSATCNAIAPLAETRRLPLIGYASDPTVSKNRRFVIRSYPSGQEEGRRTGQEALKRNFSKIGVIISVHDYPLSWREGLIAAVPPSLLVLDEQVPPDLQDFKPLLLRARQRGVESFLLCMLPGQSGLFAKQSRELGLNPRIGGCYFLEDENEAALAKGALSGAWYIIASISPEFVAKYKLRYGNQNAITGAAVHYDLGKIFALFVEQNYLSDIPKHLMEISSYDGAGGRLSTRNDKGDQFFDYQLASREIKAQ